MHCAHWLGADGFQYADRTSCDYTIDLLFLEFEVEAQYILCIYMYVGLHAHTYHHCYNGNGVINAHEDSPGRHSKLDNTVLCLLPDWLSPPSATSILGRSFSAGVCNRRACGRLLGEEGKWGNGERKVRGRERKKEREEGEEWEKRREWWREEGEVKWGEKGKEREKEVGGKGEGGQENEMQNNINRL